ncbi:WXG100 family type VII secretion target [Kineococcus sp. G2]|uniref:WXG100 family type VII secretion target n=1 Tax=Kineococcus sp. G2 TaxID=3127484 RepID=UPI00301D02AC
MAGTVGAELSTLRDLHRVFQQKAQEAIDIKNAVEGGVNSAVWTGRFSDDFRNAWAEYKRNLDNLNTALNNAADDVRTNHNNIATATGEATF